MLSAELSIFVYISTILPLLSYLYTFIYFLWFFAFWIILCFLFLVAPCSEICVGKYCLPVFSFFFFFFCSSVQRICYIFSLSLSFSLSLLSLVLSFSSLSSFCCLFCFLIFVFFCFSWLLSCSNALSFLLLFFVNLRLTQWVSIV